MKKQACLYLLLFSATFTVTPGCDNGGGEAVIPQNLPPISADEEAMMAEDRANAAAASDRKNMEN